MRFGDYTLVQQIGRGGMAEIYLAKRVGVRGFEKPLAVKKILTRHTTRSSFVEMFVEEAKLTSRLSHQNIVQIYELGSVDGEYFIAMEYVAGWDILRILQRAANQKKPVPAGIVLRVMADALRGLDYAHNATDDQGQPLRIVHFDVSPSNIIVSVTGSVKVSDFGVARAAMGLGEGSANDRFRGKIAYMSPEQLEESTAIDHRSDVFSAGICLYEALTLKRLFRAQADQQTMDNVRAAAVESKLERHPELPVPVKDILRRALSKEPSARYLSAGAMADDIETFLFDNRVRVTSRDVAEYLNDLFHGEHTPGVAALASSSKQPAGTGASFQGVSGVSQALSEAQRGPASEGGFFDADRAAGLVARLCITRASGVLVLTRTPVRKELFFSRGQLTYSRSNLDDEHLPVVLLAEKLVDLDDALVTWRHKHVITVERIIGMRMGTGGTAGVGYLQKTLMRRAFPELWSLRTSL